MAYYLLYKMNYIWDGHNLLDWNSECKHKDKAWDYDWVGFTQEFEKCIKKQSSQGENDIERVERASQVNFYILTTSHTYSGAIQFNLKRNLH